MLAGCAAWAGGRGQPHLRLEVHEDNVRARAAYARLGFVDTGVRRPYPLDRARQEHLLQLDLGSPGE